MSDLSDDPSTVPGAFAPLRDNHQMLGSRAQIPLAQRPQDRWFIAWFLIFAFTSLTADRWASLDVDICAEQSLGGLLCLYGREVDPLFLSNPQWLRVISGISAWVFGPLYLLMAWAFWRGIESVRIPAQIWGVSMIYSLTLHLWMESFAGMPSPRPLIMLIVYAPYVVVPALVLWRLRSPHPFTQAEDAG